MQAGSRVAMLLLQCRSVAVLSCCSKLRCVLYLYHSVIFAVTVPHCQKGGRRVVSNCHLHGEEYNVRHHVSYLPTSIWQVLPLPFAGCRS
jgi:hypothetical protein